MKRRIFTTIATASLLIPFSVEAAPNNFNQSQARENQSTQMPLAHRKRMDRGDKIEQILKQIELTPEQSQQIETIQTESAAELESLYQEMQTNRQQMRSLLANDADIAQLREQHAQNQEIHQQIANNRFETMLQIREVLTPEQRSQIANLIEQKRQRRDNFQ